MDPEIAALLAAGASTLVTAAATDAWQFTRRGFSSLFGRGDSVREQTTVRRLNELATAIEQAPPEQHTEVRQRQEASWEVRLSDLIADNPGLVDDLRALIEEVQAQLPSDQPTIVQHNTAHGHGRVFASLNGNVTVHEVPDQSQ